MHTGGEKRDYDWRTTATHRATEAGIDNLGSGAFSLTNPSSGQAHGLQRGANAVMPNLTPGEERSRYEIYPQKAAVHETAEAPGDQLADLLDALNR